MGRINYERTTVLPYRERQLKLDRMRQLLTRLGQPDAGLRIVHVAGTKGKGSTSAMIAAILTAAGFRTGVFSSPHLERVEERFAIDGQCCPTAELARHIERLKPIVHMMDEESAAEGDPQGGPTYFEITTAIALLYFSEQKVDCAVLEVGLGGRLDSTNVCLPTVSVVTSISYDHTKQLGTTLAAIAGEKAGIIKPGVPVVCGVDAPEAQRVIAQVAREHGCRLIQSGLDFAFTYQRRDQRRVAGAANSASGEALGAIDQRHDAVGTVDFSYHVSGQEQRIADLALAMIGRHQAANAAVALATIAELSHQGWCISEVAIRQGLRRAVLPGRVELVPGCPKIVLDTSHNPASARALVVALDELGEFSTRTLLVSISRDKDVKSIVRELVPHFDRIIVTEFRENPRAVATEQLAELVRQALNETIAARAGRPQAVVETCSIPVDAWHLALQQARPDELICIAGSFFLTAELRPTVLAAQATT